MPYTHETGVVSKRGRLSRSTDAIFRLEDFDWTYNEAVGGKTAFEQSVLEEAD